MLPLLKAVEDGKDYRLRDLVAKLADGAQLSDSDRQELLPSGQQTVLTNRVQWAKTYLKKAGLLNQPTRGTITISKEGLAVLGQTPTRIDTDFLRRYPSFLGFVRKGQPDADQTPPIAGPPGTPEEVLESSFGRLRDALADELLERVRACSPQFFERMVVELLVAMGYGGSLADAGQAVGRTGDGGIDGIIKEDKLGLDVVCIQAKRWEGTVGRPVVQAFAGSMARGTGQEGGTHHDRLVHEGSPRVRREDRAPDRLDRRRPTGGPHDRPRHRRDDISNLHP